LTHLPEARRRRPNTGASGSCFGVSVPPSFLKGFDHIDIHFDHRSSANIICLGPGELIVGDANRNALQALAREKLTIHALDVSEFVKGAGGPNCLIMPLARAGA
jgi:arginine deiminase